jgi:hypothetical protein
MKLIMIILLILALIFVPVIFDLYSFKEGLIVLGASLIAGVFVEILKSKFPRLLKKSE